MHTLEFFLDAVDSLLRLELLLLNFEYALAIERSSLLLDFNHRIRDFRYLDFDPETRRLGECFDDAPVRWPRVVPRGFHGEFNPQLVRLGDVFFDVRRGMDLLQDLEPAELPLQI